MASSPITSWQIDGETMKTEKDFILGAANGDCSHLKTLVPCKKSYDQPRQHIRMLSNYKLIILYKIIKNLHNLTNCNKQQLELDM